MVSYSQSGPSSEGALNYKIKVWPLPLCNCWLWGFLLPSHHLAIPSIFLAACVDTRETLGYAVNFPMPVRGQIRRRKCLHFCQSGSGWKRDFQGQNIKHQLDAVQIGEGRKEEKLSAGGRARKYTFWWLEICVIKFIFHSKRLGETRVASII